VFQLRDPCDEPAAGSPATQIITEFNKGLCHSGIAPFAVSLFKPAGALLDSNNLEKGMMIIAKRCTKINIGIIQLVVLGLLCNVVGR
jgi:hypothetical protein